MYRSDNMVQSEIRTRNEVARSRSRSWSGIRKKRTSGTLEDVEWQGSEERKAAPRIDDDETEMPLVKRRKTWNPTIA